MYVSKSMTYEELFSFVETVVKYDVNKYSVDLQCGSNKLFIERNGIEDRENICGVPPEVVYQTDIVRPQFDDVFGCQLEMNDGQYNQQYNKIFIDMNNEQNTKPNVGPIDEMDDEENLQGFRKCMRPVIAVDGTHLKGRFGGTMFVATAQDKNEHVYPIVFGFGDLENNLSWEWFLECLKGVVDLVDTGRVN
ncbi:hypothetical protein Ddye_015970 [Dipteronia dyeriana]|uniref:MULE transposase domain-containing protein n=1 Tax=Dipteronia dyeriana TaxID=168575 RepID=A0AAD9WZ10_9ROSI|nr:hypothetical protein Ddye_015970 [Dipteronia dyeriana]